MSHPILYGIKIVEEKPKMQKPMRHSGYCPLKEEIKRGDVKMIYFDHVGGTTKKSDWLC